ncbi:MAG TPA: hypothetical protein VKS20_15720 [Candidatus Acidoferrales bacterium]|nr:hypothetical protein [Candidatus Acidoferrales bacterium]
MKTLNLTIPRAFACAGILLALTMPCSLLSQSKASVELQKSAQVFVQGFYDWYMPIAQKNNSRPAFNVVLENKPHLLSPGLFRALEKDSEAATKSSDLVGLDFDPFLNSQDPGDPPDHYAVGKVVRKRDSYSVEVFAVHSGEKGKSPVVLPEIERRNKRWVFANFYYPRSGDLLSTLRLLAKNRRGPAK